MRLSDIKGERVFDVIADLIDPISNMAGDKEVSELFTRKKCPEGMDRREFAVKRLKQHLPVLLKTHKTDMVAILAAVEGVSYDEYKESLTLLKLMQDATELLNDELFRELFFSAQTGKDSGSAPESSAAGQ